MTTTVSVGEEKAMMAIDLVPIHPGLTEGIRALCGEAPCLSTRCPHEGVQGWVQESIRRRQADEEYSYAILRDAGLVGLCSLRGITSEPRTARLAYLIGHRHWHRGYATEATGMLIAFGFRFLTLDRIYSSCLPDNAGARRVLEKLGFRYTHEGPMPDPAPGQGERLLHFECSRRQWEARTTHDWHSHAALTLDPGRRLPTGSVDNPVEGL